LIQQQIIIEDIEISSGGNIELSVISDMTEDDDSNHRGIYVEFLPLMYTRFQAIS
jgi:hypothetical protein